MMDAFILSIFLSSLPSDRWKSYKLFFENAPYPLTVVEENGNISYANKEFCKLLGYDINEIVGENFLKFVSPEDRERLRNYHNNRINGLIAPEEYEYEAITKDGEIRYIKIRVIKLSGKRTISCKIDVTKEKESEEIFGKIAGIPAFAFLIYQNGRFIYANKAAETLTGYKRKEILGMHFGDLMGSLKEGQELKSQEIPFYTKNGKIKYGLLSMFDITYNGKHANAIMIIDITERKKAEEKLAESETMFRAITESSMVGIFIIQDESIKFANPAFMKNIGYSKKEIEKMDYLEFVYADDRENIKKAIESVFRGNKISVAEFRYITKDGEIKWGAMTGVPTEYKGRRAFLGNVTDITEIRKTYEIKRKFIEETSHYFFNPIAIAKGYLELATEEGNVDMLKKANNAQRIEKVIWNIVERGEICE